MPAPGPLGLPELPVTAWVVYLPESEARRLASPEGAPRDGSGKLLPGCISHLGSGEVRRCGRITGGAGAEMLVAGEGRYPVLPDC